MPRYKDELPAVRVYTVCDESRYLIVRNVPSFGCGDDLLKLFSSYGDIEECKPMDAEDCEPYTDVYWIKFRLVSNARFAKRKLDDSVFLGNQLQVSYAPEFESVHDTKEKLEARRKEVNSRLTSRPGMSKGSTDRNKSALTIANPLRSDSGHGDQNIRQRDYGDTALGHGTNCYPTTRVSSDKEYFTSQSMNQTVHLVREKLNKIESWNEQEQAQAEPVTKKLRTDNRRRI